MRNFNKTTEKHMKLKKGLTLLEIIIAIGILSIITVAAYSLIMSGMRVYNLNDSSVNGQSSARLALMKITQDIRSISEINSYNQIIISENTTAKTKTMDIGTSIRYVYNSNTGIITRTNQQTGAISMSANAIEGFYTEKNLVQKNEISIRIKGKNSTEVESKITFRDIA